jgi:hypothetical protein
LLIPLLDRLGVSTVFVLSLQDMNRFLAALWVLATLAVAFALDYQIKTVQVLPIESYPARITLDGITIAADPYATDEKSYTAFDVKDLNSKGYFPLHVIIQNASQGYVSLRIRNVVLVTSGGQELYTTSATIVVQDVIKGSLVSKLPKMRSHDPSVSTRSGSPLLDFTGKELTNRQIDPGIVSAGFIFFFNPEPKKALFSGGKLVIPELIDEATRKKIGPFAIPLDQANAAPSAAK